MRRLALPIAMALALGLLVTGTVSAAGTTSFTGEWIGNDPAPPDGDGSTVHLYISGGTHPQLTFTDEYGTVCDHVGSTNHFFVSQLTGTVYDDQVLLATFRSARCGTVPVRFLQGNAGASGLYILDNQGNDDPSDDTLDDGSVTWHRV